MIRACALVPLALAACARPPAPPATPPRPAPPDAAPAPATPTASACLPPQDNSAVTLLDGDAHTIHACFSSSCFAIDRRTGAITTWTSPSPIAPLPDPHVIAATTISKTHTNYELCGAGGSCVNVRRTDEEDVEDLSVAFSDDTNESVITFPATEKQDSLRFGIRGTAEKRTMIEIGDGNRCGIARFVGHLAFITTDDCERSDGHAYLFDTTGKRVAQVGGGGSMYRSFPVALDGRHWAIVAPYAYAIVVVDLPLARRQDVIDLVPIQAQPTSAPDFTLARTEAGWLVASPTGGIGVLDPTALRLSSTWIIPSCE